MSNSMEYQATTAMAVGQCDYCLLCQEPHVTSQECIKKVVCKGCGQLGHLRSRDCFLRKEMGNELEFGGTDLEAVPLDSHVNKVIQSKEFEEPSLERVRDVQVIVGDPTETVVQSELPHKASEIIRMHGKRKRKAPVETLLPGTVDSTEKRHKLDANKEILNTEQIASTQIPVNNQSQLAPCSSSQLNIVGRLSKNNNEVGLREAVSKSGPFHYNNDYNENHLRNKNRSQSFEDQLIECPRCVCKLKPDHLQDHLNEVHYRHPTVSSQVPLENIPRPTPSPSFSSPSPGPLARKKSKSSEITTSLENITKAVNENSLMSGNCYQENVCCEPTSLSSQPAVPASLGQSFEPLPRGQEYRIVCVHIETVRRSWSSETELTQIGCSSALNMNFESEDGGFFRAIKPSGLEKILDDYTLGGDLLQVLHMTREDDGSFQFRGRFEIENDPSKSVICCSEDSALGDFLSHLTSFFKRNEKVIMVAVDEDSLAILVEKITLLSAEFMKQVVGFTHWKMALELSGDFNKLGGVELEEFLQITVRPGKFLNAKDISEVLRASLLQLSWQYAGRSDGNQVSCLVSRTCQRFEDLPRPKRVKEYNETEEYIEVINSFRPSVCTNISVKKREMVSIGSDSEGEDLVDDISTPVSAPQVQNEIIDLISTSDNLPIESEKNNVLEKETIVIYSDSDEEMDNLLRMQGDRTDTAQKYTAQVSPLRQLGDVPGFSSAPQPLSYPPKTFPQIAPRSSVKPFPSLLNDIREAVLKIPYKDWKKKIHCPLCKSWVKIDNIERHIGGVHKSLIESNTISVENLQPVASPRSSQDSIADRTRSKAKNQNTAYNRPISLQATQLIQCPRCISKVKPGNIEKHLKKVHKEGGNMMSK